MTKRPSQLLAEQIETLSEQYQATATKEFAAGFKDLFARYARLKKVQWIAGTPSFNDGDPCTYSSYHQEPYINGLNSYSDSLDGDDEDEESETEEGVEPKADKADLYSCAEEGDKEAAEIVKEVEDFLNSFDEDFYEERFGNCVAITVSRRGVSETEHDFN